MESSDSMRMSACLSGLLVRAMAFAGVLLTACSRVDVSPPAPSSPSLSSPRQAADAPSFGRRVHASDSSQYEVLFMFGTSVNGYYGAYPLAALIDVDGVLYGTTSQGGGSATEYGYGTVFRITASGNETVLHSFTGKSDGAFPAAGLIYVNGSLYGTTAGDGLYGSTSGYGTVFSIGPDGSNFRTLYEFKGTPDGAFPLAGLAAARGTLYGTTYAGGADGDGTVFSVTADGKEKVLHSFSVPEGSRGPDGGNPAAGLILARGLLYGTTEFGGTGEVGTVFGMSKTGVEKMIYSFSGISPSPRNPVAGLIAIGKALYGTSYSGGTDLYGSVFSVHTDGTDERVLHSFTNGVDGANPAANLIYVNRRFYGTTTGGDSYGYGTIFSIGKSGDEQILHNFGVHYTYDGYRPVAGLLDIGNTLYGTTEEGGISEPSCRGSGPDCDWGTIFALRL
jgi:uncharacterized repeat protein (TIGR03803 family)